MDDPLSRFQEYQDLWVKILYVLLQRDEAMDFKSYADLHLICCSCAYCIQFVSKLFCCCFCQIWGQNSSDFGDIKVYLVYQQ